MKRALACALALLWPSAGHACAVCFSASDQNRGAFLMTTILLSLLPLGMIGGGLLWLRHQARRRSEPRRVVPAPAREAPAGSELALERRP